MRIVSITVPSLFAGAYAARRHFAIRNSTYALRRRRSGRVEPGSRAEPTPLAVACNYFDRLLRTFGTPVGPGSSADRSDTRNRESLQVTHSAAARLEARDLERAWLHVDLDVLVENVMPAVDSPGSLR